MTGSAPAAITETGVAANVRAGTMTSSPQPMSSARRATSIVTVPFIIRIPWRAPWSAANRRQNSSAIGPGTGWPPHRPGPDHRGHRLDVGLVDLRPGRVAVRADRRAAEDRESFAHR